jgi:hypothetical protein
LRERSSLQQSLTHAFIGPDIPLVFSSFVSLDERIA